MANQPQIALINMGQKKVMNGYRVLRTEAGMTESAMDKNEIMLILCDRIIMRLSWLQERRIEMDKELKDCPFCGEQPLLNHIEPHTHHLHFSGEPLMPDHAGSWTIECCSIGLIMDTKEEAVTAWNRRTAIAPAAAQSTAEELADNFLNSWAAARAKVAAAQPMTDEQICALSLANGIGPWMNTNGDAITGCRPEQFLPFCRALLSAQPVAAVPDGWKLVPIEPTQHMIREALNCQTYDPRDPAESEMYCLYQAMIEAAPSTGSGS